MSQSTYTVTKTICDVCGKVADEEQPKWDVMVAPHNGFREGDELDVCTECGTAIRRFVEVRKTGNVASVSAKTLGDLLAECDLAASRTPASDVEVDPEVLRALILRIRKLEKMVTDLSLEIEDLSEVELLTASTRDTRRA